MACIWFLFRSLEVLRLGIFLKISEYAILIQSPNFTDSGNIVVNKMYMEIEFPGFHFINNNPVISVEVLKLWNRYCW